MEFTVAIIGIDKIIQGAIDAGANVVPLMNAALTKSASELQRLARENAPHRTGNLQRSILTTVDYPIATVNVNERYGLYVEQGTAPHLIMPKKKKALYWKGAMYPVKVVHHPGTKANPFFENAIIESQEYIHQVFSDAANSILKQMAGV